MNYALGGSILALLGTIAVAVITAWQARKGAKDSPYSALAERVTVQEKRIDELEEHLRAAKDEVGEARRDAETSRRMAELAVAQEADVVDHHLAVVWQVSEETGYPFRTRVVIPPNLRHRLTLDDYPPTPEPSHDTGVPGIDIIIPAPPEE